MGARMDLKRILERNSRRALPVGETDWYYRNMVPKDPYRNLVLREEVMNLGYLHHDYAAELNMICSRDILFYINLYGWTLNPKEHPRRPLRPFITYPFQDKALKQISAAIGEHDIAVPKSRDMGASWMCLLALEHRWHYEGFQQFLLTSEKEELVDSHSEKSLFSKLDFWWNHLPCWLKPKMNRLKKHCENLDNGSKFDGEATVENMATGDRRTAIMMDETSKMPNADKIFTSTRDVTRCRIYNSTPNGQDGIGGPFYRQVKKAETRKIFMHWTLHPEKAKGLYRVDEKGNRVDLDPEKYDWSEDYDFHDLTFPESRKPRSIWYDAQVERSLSKKEVAQELDMDFIGSSETFADREVIMKVRDKCCEAKHAGILRVDEDRAADIRWAEINSGPFKVYDRLMGPPSIRVPKSSEYSVGVDISAGTGGQYSSESAIVVFDCRTGAQVMGFAAANVRPHDLAKLAVGVCRWYYDAFLIPEINGPGGETFINCVSEMDYWNVYRRRQSDVVWKAHTKKYGYMHKDGGTTILEALHDAIGSGEATIRDEMILNQFLEYRWDGGRLKHAGSSQSDSDADKGKAHGDRAIAAACAWMGVADRPYSQREYTEEPEVEGTVMQRLRLAEEMDAEYEDDSLVFDF